MSHAKVEIKNDAQFPSLCTWGAQLIYLFINTANLTTPPHGLLTNCKTRTGVWENAV